MAGRQQVNPDRVSGPQVVQDDVLTGPEPTKDEILESIRVGVRQALAGDTTPFDQLVDEVRREMENNVDAGQNQ